MDSEGDQERVDEFFSHSTNASRPRGVTPEHLSKIWRISQKKERDGRIAASIGSTNTLESWYVSDSEPEDNEPNHDDSTCNDDDGSFDLSFDLDNEGDQERVDEFFSHSTNASRPRGVTPEHLSKIWRISQEDARRTINTTTQTFVHKQDPTLSHNYGTNDRML